MNKNEAINLGQEALIWLAGQPEELQHFLQATGTSVDEIRQRAEDPEFLGFVLEFLTGSDEMVLALAATLEQDPASFLAARAALPGGAVPNWT